MPVNNNELTKEMIEKALQCKTADELIRLAKAEGYDIPKVWKLFQEAFHEGEGELFA